MLLSQNEGSRDKIKDSILMSIYATESSGRYQEALKWAQEYADFVPKSDPEWAAAQYKLAQIYDKVGGPAGVDRGVAGHPGQGAPLPVRPFGGYGPGDPAHFRQGRPVLFYPELDFIIPLGRSRPFPLVPLCVSWPKQE